VALPGKGSHILQHVLAKAKRASQPQQFLPRHERLVGPRATNRGVDGTKRITRYGNRLVGNIKSERWLAKIKQISAVAVLDRAACLPCKTRISIGEISKCSKTCGIIAPSYDLIDLRLWRRICPQSSEIGETYSSFSSNIYKPRRRSRRGIATRIRITRPAGKSCHAHVEQSAFVVNGESIP